MIVFLKGDNMLKNVVIDSYCDKPDKQLLIDLYHGNHPDCNGKRCFIDNIVKYFKEKYPEKYFYVYHAIVKQWFNEYGIPILTDPKEIGVAKAKYPKPDRDALFDLYINKKWSTHKILAYYKALNPIYSTMTAKTVNQWLRSYSIPLRSKAEAVWNKYPVPPKSEIVRLYLTEKKATILIAKYFREQNPNIYANLTVDPVKSWLHLYEIPVRDPAEEYPKTIFTLEEIALYLINNYEDLYPDGLTGVTVSKWFTKLGILIRDPSAYHQIPVPNKDELFRLFIDQGMSVPKIANFYRQKNPDIYGKLVDNVVRIWLRAPGFYVTNSWKDWEKLTYEMAEHILADQYWSSGHGANKIKLQDDEKTILKPEFIIYNQKNERMKLIDAKISGYAITSKDLMKYPFGSMNRIVEFWIFEGNSRVKIYHNNDVIVKQIN